MKIIVILFVLMNVTTLNLIANPIYFDEQQRVNIEKSLSKEKELSISIGMRSSIAYRDYLWANVLNEKDNFWKPQWGEKDRLYFNVNLLSGASYTNSHPISFLEVNAFTNPIIRDNYDLFISSKTASYLGFDIRSGFGTHFTLNARPFVRYLQNNDFGKNAFHLNESYVAFNIESLSIDAGRIQPDWGVGKISRLLFSGQNAPLWMFRLKNETPIETNDFLSFLGKIKYEVFFSILDDDHTFSNPKLLGMYFAILPKHYLEISLGQTLIFGGSGSSTNNPVVILGDGFFDEDNPTNRNFLIAIRSKILSMNLEPYAEIMVEDCCRWSYDLINSRDMVNLFGIHVNQFGTNEDFDLTIEWIRTNHISYRHGTYSSGLIYHNRIIGPQLGPDAHGIYLRTRYFFSSQFWFESILSYEIRGRTGKALFHTTPILIEAIEPMYEMPDERTRFNASIYCKLTKNITLIPVLALEKVTHENYLRGKEKFNYNFGFSILSNY